MFSNGLQPWHIIVLVIVLIALFGAKRLPGAARGIGQSLRIFKSEARKMRDGDGDSEGSAGATAEEPVKQQLQQARQSDAEAVPREPREAPNETKLKAETHTEKQA